MFQILMMTGWTFAVGFIAFWIGHASRATEVKSLQRDRYYLRRYVDQLARANTELDLDLELERIRNV